MAGAGTTAGCGSRSGLEAQGRHASAIRKVEGGFPHSEIPGSKLVRSSPRLIAAYHVLHRLSAPRHPPNALKALDRSRDPCAARERQPYQRLPVTDLRGHKKTSDKARWSLATVCLPNMTGGPQLSLRLRHTFPLHDVTSLRTRAASSVRRPSGPRQTCIIRIVARTARVVAARLRRHPKQWWRQTGSNRRPHACKARALPTELCPRTRRPWLLMTETASDRGGPGTTRTSDLTLIRGAL